MPVHDAVYERETTRPLACGTQSMIVGGHYLASQAGFAVLEAGGNAIDAAVAAAITETVVQPEQVGFAGIAPSMVYWSDTGEVITLPGVGPWPMSVDPTLFRASKGVPEGIRRTVVPAAPATYLKLLEHYGTLSFSDVAGPAIRLARDGFGLHPFTAGKIAYAADDFRRWPSSAEVFLPGGSPPKPHHRFVQADLAQSLQYMVDEETAASARGRIEGLRAAHDAFYQGDIAKQFSDYHKGNGGFLTFEDMATFQAELQRAQQVDFAFGTMCTMGFDGQGPMIVEVLRILENFDLTSIEHNSARYLHMIAEVLKLAFSDREYYFGDPKFTDVPKEVLLSKDFAEERFKAFRWDKAWPEMPPPGRIAGVDVPVLNTSERGTSDDINLHDTSFVGAMDKHGNVAAISPSDANNNSPIIPGTGLCPSSRGAQSRTDPDHPASIFPGKKPRVTPNPLMVLRNGRPYLALGTPGADAQPQANLQVLMNILVFGMNIQQAVEAPRICSESFPASFAPHTNRSGVLKLEANIGADVAAELARLGHKIEQWPAHCWRAGGVCVLQNEDGMMRGAADPRRAAYALGW